jgi:hypothetical protein
MASGGVQTSYDSAMDVAVAGLRFSNYGLVTSRIAEGDITFGLAVKRGTDADSQVAVGAGAGFIGVALHTISKEAAISDATIKIEDTEGVDVMRSGVCWASPSNEVDAGDAVSIVTATGVLKGGAGDVGDTEISNAYWDSSCGAGELALLVVGLGSVGTVVTE